ncbi:MAG: hypothetical protein LBV21_03260 [Candidatus Adiutrix sp.]|jgi:chromosome segregation ATPase|nr:hypothetical protein [Candidatus Adiutrix sp.]
MTRPHNPDQAQAGEADGWDFVDNSTVLAAFLSGERRADFQAFMGLAKEMGRLLTGFVPPADGYEPAPPEPPPRLSLEAGRDLGAPSVRDFFALALGGATPAESEVEAGRVRELFPLGPESARPALAAVEAEIRRLDKAMGDLEQNWPLGRSGLEAALRPLEARREALAAGRAEVVRAARLWPRLKEEAVLWPEEAKALWRKARRLEESLDLLLKADWEPEGEAGLNREARSRRALTRAAHDLKVETASARALLLEGERCSEELESLTTELDDLLALVIDGSEPDRDWEGVGRLLADRLTGLSRAEKALTEESARTTEALAESARVLAETEKSLAGARGRESQSRLEAMSRGVAALWRSTVDRRREMARLYFFLPDRLGRPAYLEKIFLTSARILGRTQALLEDLRHRLALAEGRLSGTRKLKGESSELLERLRRPSGRPDRLNTARRRLKSLLLAARRRSVPQAERSGRDHLEQSLDSAVLEKELLTERLTATRRSLGEMGLIKARLIRVFERKTELLRAADLERVRLAEENRRLKAARGEMARRRAVLAETFTQIRGRFKELRDSVRQYQSGDFEGLLAERREAAAQLEELRREREKLETERRELTSLIRKQAARLAEAGARTEALSAELNRHREEVAEASRSRRSLGEVSAALRRRLDLLIQAHGALKRNLLKKDRRLAQAEAGQGLLEITLTRQKRNLLRLVATRQKLRAELGSARLKLTDLETEHTGLLVQLDEARRRALASNLEKSSLTARLSALAGEKEAVTGQLTARLAALAGENEAVTGRLTALAEENEAVTGRLAALTEEKEAVIGRLTARNERLEEEKRSLEERLGGVEARKEQLAARLAELERDVSGSLLPFISILGEALWRGEAGFKRAREAHGLAVTRLKLEGEVREANLRLTGAAREIELTEAHQAERGEWERAQTRREGELTEAHQIEREEWAQARARREAELVETHQTELGRWAEALARREAELTQAHQAEREKELAAIRAERERELAAQTDRAEREKELAEALIRREEELLEVHRAERGQWSETLDRREGELAQAQARLRALAEERGLLVNQVQERESIVASLGRRSRKLGAAIGLMKRRYGRRLTEAGQVESGLRLDLDRRARELEESKSRLAELEPLVEHFFQAAEKALPPGDANLELVRYLRAENRALLLEAEGRAPAGEPSAALRARLEELQPLVVFLARSFVTGVAELASARRERAELESALAGREAELKAQATEVAALKNELAQADRDLTENDGRLEAAWAAVNYLGARADDRLVEIKGQMERQARQVDGLTAELARRDARVRDLESRQDKLSLLYWTLVAQAGETAGPTLTAPVSWDRPADGAPTLEERASDQARNSGGFSLGRQLLEGAKKVARRSLFSLILAGSLVLAGPTAEVEASAGPVGEAVPALPPGLATRFDSVYVGRSVGLELVEPSPRLAGRQAVERRLTEMVGDLAAAQGLAGGEFLRLIRSARSPEDTVHLADFGGRPGRLALLRSHFPKLVKHLDGWPAEVAAEDRLTALLKSAADFKPGEGGFWERLFFDLWSETGDPGPALASLLNFLKLKAALASEPRLEFAGRLAPFAYLENLGPDRCVEFLAPYIKTSWFEAGARPRELAARRLAGDLYFNARMFRLPLTLFVALAHQETEEGLAVGLFRRGATLALHHRAAHLARLARAAAVAWGAGRPPLCDLDEALAQSENELFIEAVYRKKMALVQAVNQSRSAGDSLLAALPD